MPPRHPSQETHVVVKAAAALIVLGAVGVGFWSGSRPRVPRPVPIDPAAERVLAATPMRTEAELDHGEVLFADRCAGCHTIGGGDRKGPDLARAALRRDPLWVELMVSRPDSMFRDDSIARWILDVHDIDPGVATDANPDLRALTAFLRSFRPGR